MKKFALKTLAIVLFTSTALISCSSDDGGETIILKKSLVSLVEGPTTGVKNQEVTLNVSYGVENSCGNFNKFVETISGNTKTVEVESKYVGSNCGQVAATKVIPYKFTVNQAGTYIFKFKKSASEFITQTVVISE